MAAKRKKKAPKKKASKRKKKGTPAPKRERCPLDVALKLTPEFHVGRDSVYRVDLHSSHGKGKLISVGHVAAKTEADARKKAKRCLRGLL